MIFFIGEKTMLTFWILMLIAVLLPLMMLGFGFLFYKRPPKKINYLFGYRSSLSLKNRDTWDFAHKHCGKIWLIFGTILLIASTAAYCGCVNIALYDVKLTGTISGALCAAQCIVLIISVLPTQIALKNTFDDNGNRK